MALLRRVFSLETEYAVSFHATGRKTPDAKTQVEALQGVLVDQLGASGCSFLSNGAKFYYDGGHPEWCLPECHSAREAATYDKAADHLLGATIPAARERLARHGFHGELFVTKNNVDSVGHTFGCHENYMALRDAELLGGEDFLRYAVRCLVPFLVTRQALCGAGRLVCSGDGPDSLPSFQIAQRADAIESVVSSDTRVGRAIVNLGRETEPLAAGNCRRLHLIVGDSNLSGWATWMKLGTTGILLRAIEDLFLADVPLLADPIAALRQISRDPTCKTAVPLRDGSMLTAVEIQGCYWDMACDYLDRFGSSDEEVAIMGAWGRALEDLERDPARLRDRSDWVLKKWLMDAHLDRFGGSWASWPRQSEALSGLLGIELRYHDVAPEGFFSRVCKPDTLVSEQEIHRAQVEPPPYTRAAMRSRLVPLVRVMPLRIEEWDRVCLGEREIMLADPLEFDGPEFPDDLPRGTRAAQAAALGAVQEGLRHPDPDVRLRAATDLGWRKSEAAIGLLAELARADPDDAVRRAAARALGAIGGDIAAAALVECRRDASATVRWAIEEALKRLDRKATDAAKSSVPGVENLEPPVADGVRTLVDAIRGDYLANPHHGICRLFDEFDRCLHSRRLLHCEALLREIGEQAYPLSPVERGYLASREEALGLCRVAHLKGSEAQPAVLGSGEALLEERLKTVSPRERLAVIKAAQRSGYLRPLMVALEAEDAHTRVAGAAALDSLVSKAGATALLELVGQGDWFVRWRAASILARRHRANPRELMTVAAAEAARAALARESDPLVRRELAQVLEAAGDRAATRLLLPLIEDGDADVRFTAVEALASIGDRGALPALRRVATGTGFGGASIAEAVKKAVERIEQRHPLPHVEAITVCSGMAVDGRPVRPADLFLCRQPVVSCAIALSGTRPDTLVAVRWLRGGLTIAEDRKAVGMAAEAGSAAYLGFELPRPSAGYAVGEYQLEVFVNEEDSGEAAFRVVDRVSFDRVATCRGESTAGVPIEETDVFLAEETRLGCRVIVDRAPVGLKVRGEVWGPDALIAEAEAETDRSGQQELLLSYADVYWSAGAHRVVVVAETGERMERDVLVVQDVASRRAVMCRHVDRRGRPVHRVSAYLPDEDFCCAVQLTPAPPGTEVVAQWFHAGQPIVDLPSVAVTERSGDQCVAFSITKPQADWPVGEYEVRVRVAGGAASTIKFSVA